MSFTNGLVTRTLWCLWWICSFGLSQAEIERIAPRRKGIGNEFIVLLIIGLPDLIYQKRLKRVDAA